MAKKYFVDIVINKEKLSDNSTVFVAHCSRLGVASQGSTTEQAIKNVKEAVEVYLEEQPDRYDELVGEELPLFSMIEVLRSAKVTHPVR